MPKLVYSNSKGLVQEAGSGVDLGKARAQGLLRPVATVTAQTYSPSLKDSGILILQDHADGCVITLPAATAANAGWWCEVLVKTTISTNGIEVNGADAAHLLYGSVLVAQNGSDTAAHKVVFTPNHSDDHQYKADTNVKGRHAGTNLKFEIVGLNVIRVSGVGVCAGNAATPFT